MHEFLHYLTFALYGGVGALLCAAAKQRTLEMPRVVRKRDADGDVRTVIDLGFLAAPLLGAIVAAYVDGRPATALAWGALCGYAGPAILNWVFDPWLKKLGVPLHDGLPPAARDEEA
jgi:hypothetical protein